MVVIFSEPARIKYPFYYNEQKVSDNSASLLYAGNYIKDAPDLTLSDKLQRFHLLQQLNDRTVRNTLHTVLGFHPAEKIPTPKMIQIARDFMDRIGFGKQPYLVYQHFDAAHPHLHIVSTNIDPDGRRIDMNRLYIRKGREACRAIEIEHDLLRVSESEKIPAQYLLPNFPQIAEYGESPTGKTIAGILDHIFAKYNFTSIPELNAILRLFRCKVETGHPDSILHRNKGVIYRIIDSQGQNIGAHINAHTLPNNPGLPYLQKLFDQNTHSRITHIDNLQGHIDYILRSRPTDLPSLIKRLKTDSIHLFPYANKDNQLYGLCFVDLQSSIAIAGGSLGPAYTSSAILSRPTHHQNASQPLAPSQNSDLIASPEITLGPNHDINRALKMLAPFRQDVQLQTSRHISKLNR